MGQSSIVSDWRLLSHLRALRACYRCTDSSKMVSGLIGETVIVSFLSCKTTFPMICLLQVKHFWECCLSTKLYRGGWNGWWGKTNKDTDWRFQAPPNPQVLLPLMAQRESEVGGRETVLIRKSKSKHPKVSSGASPTYMCVSTRAGKSKSLIRWKRREKAKKKANLIYN